ncbi:MAG: MarR family transcriptional regulator [Gemmatimonadetes bacterium]|uniref:MarR family transcriptional regulator n=1 Tax=Candidatus Kutchimonas denitrificans TaxID=3056748 RepID=A0AAE4ZCY9_9BACT|nr:MarR family transcriptional regulator [Gemmatimonadota bacterium]NIR76391.1 MarR family transcriptional regulator [Candidatus Kutchimonas denitrificans]NIS03201.1 MarR family transcriptional regulator [Gemmatimonadota bacterium]NIT66374.1 MarR family transcriptional regulator [Gemmatimonadota bacterium]NIU54453.1 MarR family transcriptional regulator [Gemmatimonadota bacterium]
MTASVRARLIQDLLGSAHIFSTAVNDLMEKRLHAVTGEQLTFSQLKLLKLVARAEAYNISEVAAFLGVSNAAASKGVDRLVRRGLLTRHEAEGDRRAVQLGLTAEGEHLLGEYERVLEEALEEVFGAFTEDGLQQTAEQLDRLSVRLVGEDADAEERCFRCSIFFREKCLLRAQEGRTCHFHLQRHRKSRDSSGPG